jgi:hypothetical protein
MIYYMIIVRMREHHLKIVNSFAHTRQSKSAKSSVTVEQSTEDTMDQCVETPSPLSLRLHT